MKRKYLFILILLIAILFLLSGCEFNNTQNEPKNEPEISRTNFETNTTNIDNSNNIESENTTNTTNNMNDNNSNSPDSNSLNARKSSRKFTIYSARKQKLGVLQQI